MQNPPIDGKLGQGVPGYSVFTNRVKVGAGAEDAMEACNSVKAWRMADAVDGSVLHVILCSIAALLSRRRHPMIHPLAGAAPARGLCVVLGR